MNNETLTSGSEDTIQNKIEQLKAINERIDKQINELKSKPSTTADLSSTVDLIKEVCNLMQKHANEETASLEELKQAASLIEKTQKLSTQVHKG